MHLLVITRKVDKSDIRMGFFWDWIVAFAKEADRLSVICLEEGDSSGLPNNVRVYSMGKEKGKNRIREFVQYVKFLWDLVPLCDGVFVHMIPLYVFIAGPFAKVFGKKLYLWYTHGKRDWRLRATQGLVTGYLSATKESFPLETRKPIIAFGHALNLDKFPFLKSQADDGDQLTLTTVSRITPVKNLDVLIRTVALLKEEISKQIRCEIIGVPALPEDREELAKLHALVSELGLEECVEFLGGLSNDQLSKEFLRADVFVNLSGTQSLDKAILEPMACGVITVTSNRSFRPVFGELADHLMVECNPQSVAERILELYSTSHEEKERIRRRLREIVERDHNMNVTIPKIVQLYKKH